jgi:hypothetical protein
MSAATYTTQLFLSGAQVAVQFAPVPWLAPVVGIASTLMSMINQAHMNKYAFLYIYNPSDLMPPIETRSALKQLQDRSLSFLVVIQQRGDGASALEQQRLVAGAEMSVSFSYPVPVLVLMM